MPKLQYYFWYTALESKIQTHPPIPHGGNKYLILPPGLIALTKINNKNYKQKNIVYTTSITLQVAGCILPM